MNERRVVATWLLTTVTAMLVLGLPAPASAVTCVTSGVAGTAYLPGVNCRTVDIGGVDREYYVYVPPVLQPKHGTVPVIVAYHGSGGSGKGFIDNSGWTQKADAEGLVVAFPSALTYWELKSSGPETLWNTWADETEAAANVDLSVEPPGYPAGAPWPADDYTFTAAILDDLAARAQGDPKRTYGTGFSNGGIMALRLAVEMADRFAAVASYEGPLQVVDRAAAPIPTLFTVGTAGGEGLTLDPDELMAHAEVITNVETITPSVGIRDDRWHAKEDRSSTTLTFNVPDRTGMFAPFTMLVLEAVGHEYPRPDNNPVGFSAPDLHWEFFEKGVGP